MHLHVHAHVVDSVFAACVPVELFGFEGVRRSQFGALAGLEALYLATHVDFVGRFFVGAACSRVCHVCVGRSECVGIGFIILRIGRQVDRRLSVFAALIIGCYCSREAHDLAGSQTTSNTGFNCKQEITTFKPFRKGQGRADGTHLFEWKRQ